MVVTSDLWKQLLPDTQAALSKDWGEFRGSEDAGRLNRYGFEKGWQDSPTRGMKVGGGDAGNWAGNIGTGAAVGATLGAVGGPVGAGLGGVVGGFLGAVKTAWGGRRTRMNIPGQGGAFGKNYEGHLTGLAPALADDPYKTALAMLFMAPSKRQDPYKFSSEKVTRRNNAFRFDKSERWKFWLDNYYKPTEYIGDAARTGAGFLDWKGYSGMGGDDEYRPSVMENLLSRTLYDKHRDLWNQERNRSTTRTDSNLNLRGSGANWTERTKTG